MCSGSEAGSYLRLIDFLYHSILGLRVINKKKNNLEGRALQITFKVEAPKVFPRRYVPSCRLVAVCFPLLVKLTEVPLLL